MRNGLLRQAAKPHRRSLSFCFSPFAFLFSITFIVCKHHPRSRACQSDLGLASYHIPLRLLFIIHYISHRQLYPPYSYPAVLPLCKGSSSVVRSPRHSFSPFLRRWLSIRHSCHDHLDEVALILHFAATTSYYSTHHSFNSETHTPWETLHSFESFFQTPKPGQISQIICSLQLHCIVQ